MNFKASDGSWQAIDTRLVANADGGVVNKAGPFSAKFAGQADAPTLLQVASAAGSVSFGFDGQSTDAGSVLSPSSSVTETVSGDGSDTVSYAGAVSGVDVRYQVLPVGVKEAIVLNQPLEAGRQPEFQFSLSPGSGLRTQAAKDGTIQIVDAAGKSAFAIPNGVAIDAKGEQVPVSYRLVPSADAGASTFFVSVDPKWLSDPSRAYPVTIDPSLTAGAADDTFVANGADANTNFYFFGQYDSVNDQWFDRAGTYGGQEFRAFQHFDTSQVAGTYVSSATWHGYAWNVVGTTPVVLTARPVSGAWDPSTLTWNNKPAMIASPINTGGFTAGVWKTANITSWVQNWASGTWTNNGIALTGPSTGRVKLASFWTGVNSPYIDITYDAYSTTSHASASGNLNTWTTKTHTPTLSIQVDDADTSSGLTATFQIWYDGHAVYTGAQGTGNTTTRGGRSSWITPYLPDGDYDIRAWANDGVADGPLSGWFDLKVDGTAPNTPTVGVVQGSTNISANSWTTGGGTATVNLGGNGSADLHGFYWGLDQGDNPNNLTLASANAASVSIDPSWGWHDLVVRAIDNAGNLSATPAHFTFGWGIGGLAQPTENTFTQGTVTVQANAPASFDGMTLQWRRSESDSWDLVPPGDVGVTNWPVSTTPGTDQSVFPTLTWNAAATTGDTDGSADGPLQIRVGFSSGTGDPTYSEDGAAITDMTLNLQAFGSASFSEQVGPGSVDLLSGDFSVSATDTSTPAGVVFRTFQSLDPAAQGSVFGPGWSSNLATGVSRYGELVDHGDYVTVTDVDGTETNFPKNTDGSYQPPDGSTLTLTKSGTVFLLKDLSFDTTTFTNVDTTQPDIYVATAIDDSTDVGAATTSWGLSASGVTRVTSMSAAVSGVTCTSPLTTKGCQTLTFTYATTTTATGTDSAHWGDYAGQLQTVHYTAWDPDLGTPAMHTVDVSTYLYDSNGMLRAQWDPRISPALKTMYSYDSYGHVATLTPPGLEPFTFNYTPLSGEPASTGRLRSVSRPALPSGTATTTVVYNVPVSGTGAPYDLGASSVAAWAQHDVPTAATAIFPPDQVPASPPTSYTRATVYYLDNQGQLVNAAEPGGDITTTEYDEVGNQVRSLSAGNRQLALDSSTNPIQQAALARILDAQVVYNADGTLVTDTYGPAHVVDLPDGTSRPSRAHVHNCYDVEIGSSNNCTTTSLVPADLASEAPFDLTTYTVESATPIDGTVDQDTRVTKYVYKNGSDELGWTLGTPLQTILEPGSSPHLNLATTVRYNADGSVTARILPVNPAGGDAHETDFAAYATGNDSSVPSACRNHPEYADLPCEQYPAAQPTGTTIPSTQITGYNMYGQPETTVDTSGSVTRTTTVAYDAAGRQTSLGVTTTGSGTGTATPTVTSTYDSSTGLPYQTSTASPSRTITRNYDTLGRMTSYTDADSNTTYYTYDLLNRPATINDGKGTITYSYDNVGSEHRGLPTTISDSQIGAFTATYDHNGNLAAQTYPGGLLATYNYDQAGETTNLAYTKGSGFWPASPTRYNIHGEQTETTSSLFKYAYSYDPAGRLTKTNETNIFGCSERDYSFDPDTNRTSLKSDFNAGWYHCPPDMSGATTTNYSYDQADRIGPADSTHYIYDPLGRTTQIPAANSPVGYTTTLDYYTSDLEHTITSNSVTTTYNIDPNQRYDTFVLSTDGQTHTNHYTGDGDSPAWVSENTAGTNWTRYLNAFNGMAASINQAGTITLNMINVHGDIVAPAATGDTTWNVSATQTETDEYGNESVTSRYDYLGTHQRKRDASQLQLMGVRLYNPDTGRFLQTDPVLGGSANQYDYVSADPINSEDVGGTCATCILKCHAFDGLSVSGFLAFATSHSKTAPCNFTTIEGSNGKKRFYSPIWKKTKAGGRWIDPHGDCSHAPDHGQWFDFHNACSTHDYVYDLMRFGNTSGPHGGYRKAADNLFHGDMNADCKGRGILGTEEPSCRATAELYYEVVHVNSVRQHFGVP